jgi:4-amino-4-deoxy-L-arabinose transferase-like glycosyltransferase
MTNAVAANSPWSEGPDSMPERSKAKWRFDLTAVSVLALVIRLAWIWFGGWVAGDSAWYLNVARNLAFSHVFGAGNDGVNLAPTAFRPPLYPALIALLWFGESAPIHVVVLLQAFLGAATVMLVYLMARDQFSRGVSLLAATGMAVAPMTGHFTAAILNETLFTFLLTLGAFCWGRKLYTATGLVFGFAALTRVAILPFVVLLPLLTLFGPWRSNRRDYLRIMLLVFAVISIWTVRNAVQFHRFIPVAAGGYGTNLFLGSMETSEADDVKKRKALLSRVDQAGGQQHDESAFDRARLRAAFARMAENPRRWLVARMQQYPRLFIDSGSYMFRNDHTSFRSAIREGLIGQVLLRSMFVFGNVLVFVFALVGSIAERRGFVRLSHLTLFPIFLMIISLPFWIEPRYGLPMMPLVAILSAVGLARSLQPFSRA